MQTILKYPLYRRTQPSNDAPALGYQPAGAVVDVADIVQGKAIDGNSSWLKATDGYYYWSGGVSRDEWWITDFGIEDFWTVTRGKDATVALLDSGLSKHPDLNLDFVKGGYNFVDGSTNFLLDEPHCTHMAGIIAGQGKIITGVAPEVSLWIGRVLDQDGLMADITKLKSALQYILDKNLSFDVINMSIQIPPGDYQNISGYQDDINKLINTIIQRFGTIVVAAIGDFYYMIPTFIDSLPSYATGAFSVTGTKRDSSLCTASGYSNKIDLASPGQDITSLYPVGVSKPWTGTSQAAAYASGVFALAKSYWLKKKPQVQFDAKKMQDIFRQTALPSGSATQFGAGIIQPKKIKTQIDLL